MSDLKCKIAVIGAGPGGYVCAIRAAQLGLDVIVVDAGAAGGTCLNVGCIPSKALIHAADEFHKIAHVSAGQLGITAAAPGLDLAKTMAWKDGIVSRLTGGVEGLLKRAGARFVRGRARLLDGQCLEVATQTGPQVIRAEAIVLATGAAPVELPGLPFGGDILTSTGALALSEVPGRLAVIGAGYIGLELGTAFAKLGSEVTVIEAGERALAQYDAGLVRPVLKRLEALGVGLLTSTKATGYADGQVQTEAGDIAADKVLVTVGRRPLLQGLGLEALSPEMAGAYLKINEICQTSLPGLYAIGDITGEPMLAHRAMAQGEMVAEHLAGHKVAWDKCAIPAVCFTDPELVSCGAAPGEIEASAVAEFPFAANGRALTLERDDGLIQVVYREADHVILGLHGVGAGIAELSASFALAIEMGARLEDVAATIHAHPTQSEGLAEACMKALDRAVHI
ncbi:MAG: dihydrolipoyl dehydrogenase [Pseudomonadota bacterium]